MFKFYKFNVDFTDAETGEDETTHVFATFKLVGDDGNIAEQILNATAEITQTINAKHVEHVEITQAEMPEDAINNYVDGIISDVNKYIHQIDHMAAEAKTAAANDAAAAIAALKMVDPTTIDSSVFLKPHVH